MTAPDRICNVVYDTVEHASLDLVRQDLLNETHNDQISKYFKVQKASQRLRTKMFIGGALIIHNANFVQGQATETVAGNSIPTT